MYLISAFSKFEGPVVREADFNSTSILSKFLKQFFAPTGKFRAYRISSRLANAGLLVVSTKYAPRPGLPDGIFSYQKFLFRYIFECLGIESLVILWSFWLFYGYWVHFMAIWYTLWSFGIHIFRFGMLCREKSGNPDLDPF
jgi:hypothetical protein